MKRREALIGDGFAFEYSATFGQAVAKGKTIKEQEIDLIKNKAKMYFNSRNLNHLDNEQRAIVALNPAEQRAAKQTAMFETYAKAVLFDYSYKYFYADGYGKESLILNMDDAGYKLHSNLYLTACCRFISSYICLIRAERNWQNGIWSGHYGYLSAIRSPMMIAMCCRWCVFSLFS